MSIDRIGKGPVAPPVTTPGTAGTTETQGASFKATTDETRAGKAAGSEPTSRLDDVRSGRISLDEYLDLQVHDATSHLQGLSPSKMKVIQEHLRGELQNDPFFVDLVKKATGRTPEPSRE